MIDKITTDPPLAEFRNQLKAIGPEWPKRLRKVNAAAAKLVTPRIRERYNDLYQRITGQGRSTIRASASQTSAGVIFGKSSVPYVVGQEFGSNRYKQFAPWSGKGPGGRGSAGKFAYPTIRAMTPEIREMHASEMDDLFREAFPD